jgi:putative endonuclease
MGKTQIIGNRGERIAQQYLEKKGYEIIARNWRAKTGEIDLIARHGRALVFVEVKFRSSTAYGQPEDTVTASKQRKLLLTTEYYCLKNNVDAPWRIDVVAIAPRPDGTDEILHFENAIMG